MRQLTRSIFIFVVLALGTGLIYPLVITGLSQLLFSRQANGSLITVGGKVAGSTLIGQSFTSPKYFRGRPSAIDKPYDATNSGGSNFGPTNKKYLDQVESRVKEVRDVNGLGLDAAVPADLVLASASGLDPHISVDAARLQAPRVAKARGLAEEDLKRLIDEMAQGQYWGPRRVNVLELNLALDGMRKK